MSTCRGYPAVLWEGPGELGQLEHLRTSKQPSYHNNFIFHTCAPLFVWVCVHAHREARGRCWMFSIWSLLYFSRQALLICRDWLTRKPHESSCFHLLNSRIPDSHFHSCPVALGIQIQVLILVWQTLCQLSCLPAYNCVPQPLNHYSHTELSTMRVPLQCVNPQPS